MAALDPDMNMLINAGDALANLPLPFSDLIDANALKKVWLVPPSTVVTPTVVKASSGLAFDEPLVLSIPGLDAVQVVIGAVGDATIFEFEIAIRPVPSFTLMDVALSLRFRGDYFKPARLNSDTNQYEVDPDKAFVEIAFESVTLVVDADGGLDISTGEINLPPTMIGDTGVVIEATELQLFLNDTATPPGRPAGTRGVFIPSATVHLPESLGRTQTLTMTDAFIGNGGFSGTLSTPLTPPVEEDFGGIPVTLENVSLTFVQNALVESSLTGTMVVPYFDKRVSVQLIIGIDGHLAIVVTGVAPGDGTYDPVAGILTLTTGPLTFDLRRLEVELLNGNALFRAAGKVTPDVIEDVTFPSFEIEELTIDHEGRLSVAGGWIDLPSQLTVSLYGFILEITKVGFGTFEDGRRWIGMSGGLKLVDGLQAGASVEGLRIAWRTGESPTLLLDGVGIELQIPDVLTIRGAVALTQRQFRGAVDVVIEPIEFAVGGQFVAGTLEGSGQKYFAIFLHTELPVGIPLGGTGLALYGMAGLYANNMVPDRAPNQGWYFNPDGSNGWYFQNGVGVENLAKWKGEDGGMGFGAGVTLGTFPDNGYTFNGRVLLVLSFPGPTIFIEGKANLFKKRSALGDDATFRAIAILEPKQSFLVGLDAQYKFRSGGELLDIGGSAEAFFDFNDASMWHLWLGQRQLSRRIRARAFQLFNVDAFFMLDARKLEVGAGWRFEKRYGFKHLSVRVGASLETEASVSWHPSHFSGSVGVEGRAELRAFGFGLGLSIGASVKGEVFDPLFLRGTFRVRINLPWPLPDPSASITLQWKEALESPPALPLPLREASIEIPARSMRWPFRRGTNLLPSYDQGDFEFASGSPTGNTDQALQNAVLVPSDSFVGLGFSRAIDDTSVLTSMSTSSPVKADLIADPVRNPADRGYTVAYSLMSMELEKLAPITSVGSSSSPVPPGSQGIGWVTVAHSGVDGPGDVPTLLGSWTPAEPPQLTDAEQPDPPVAFAQTKLLVNAKSPFDYLGVGSATYQDWFAQTYPGYPCIPPGDGEGPETRVATFDFEIGTDLRPSESSPPYEFQFDPPDPDFTVHWTHGGDITALDPSTVQGIEGLIDRGLRVADIARRVDDDPGQRSIFVTVPDDADTVLIRVAAPASLDHIPEDRGRFHLNVENPLEEMLDESVTITNFETVGGVERLVEENDVPMLPGGIRGLRAADRLQIDPKVPALRIDLEVQATFTPPPGSQPTVGAAAILSAYWTDGTKHDQPIALGNTVVALRADRGKRITRVNIYPTPGDYNVFLTRINIRTPVNAFGISGGDSQIETGPFEEVDGLITVAVQGLKFVRLGTECGGEFAIVELALPTRRDLVNIHTTQALERFNGNAAIFEPDTYYRMTVRTKREANNRSAEAAAAKATFEFLEQVYFRTAKVPGVGVPAAPEGTQTSDGSAPKTGFEDLAYYVKRTTPEVPPAAGGHRSPARASYRSYDANVEFSVDNPYIELLYRLGRRDLTLRLFDADGAAVRGANGRILIASTGWGESANPEIATSARRWIDLVNAAACRSTPEFDDAEVLGSEELTAPSEEMTLAPEALHQVRLIPMLLHEAFVNARLDLHANGQGLQLDGWRAEFTGAVAPDWVVEAATKSDLVGGPVPVRFVKPTGAVTSALVYEGPVASRGEGGHDHPSQWTDVRANVQLRWRTAEVGFEVRRASAGDLIRLSLDRATGARRLVAVSGGVTTVLAEDTVTFPEETVDQIFTIECVGDRVEVFQHVPGEPAGEPIFQVTGAPTFAGTVALYTNQALDVRFGEIRVHDLRADASTAYAFDFITSRYANFQHHLHSFDDQLFEAQEGEGLTAGELAAQAGLAVAVPATPGGAPGLGTVSPEEARAFDALEEAALGPARLQAPERIEILRASHDPAVTALLIRSPEPLRWERTQIAIAAAASALDLGVPEDLKLAEVNFATDASQERVGLLVRSAARLAGHRIESRPLPTVAEPDPPWTLHYAFAEDETEIGDGTQVHVISGDADHAPARAPGTTQRFVAASAAEAELHFAAPGVELRLVAPTGTTLHQRQFLSPDAYSGLAAQAIRKLDGTALFLLLPAGSAIPGPATSMRVALTFARNAGAEHPIVRQAGAEQSETAVLDLVFRVA